MADLLKVGSTGPEVVELQQTLNKLVNPMPRLAEDGIFGPGTRSAVLEFQKREGLPADGIVGPKTQAALDQKAGASGGATAAAPNWMAIAETELKLGVAEIPGAKHSPRILQYHATTTLHAKSDEVAWCSSFVNWCLLQAGIRGTNSALAASWMDWGQATEARVGAITVIYNGAAAKSSLTTTGNHVGFLLEDTATHFKILGGNQSDKVKVSTFSKATWRLKGYRWPAG